LPSMMERSIASGCATGWNFCLVMHTHGALLSEDYVSPSQCLCTVTCLSRNLHVLNDRKGSYCMYLSTEVMSRFKQQGALHCPKEVSADDLHTGRPKHFC